MQKIFRINILSRNQAARHTRKQAKQLTKSEWRDHDARSSRANKQLKLKVRQERENRREDWLRGPLAPNRDTGAREGVYGTVDQSVAQGPIVPKLARSGPKEPGWLSVPEEEEWVGEGPMGNIVTGDRVCVVNGREGVKGKIGVVNMLSVEREEVTVAGVNMTDVEIPESAPNYSAERRKYVSTELPISIHDVRLVHRMTDEDTGMDRDVIVRYLRGGAPYYQREYGSNIPRHTRYVVGEETVIPWPAPDIPEQERTESDTTRRDVEDMTFLPSILDSPLPGNVIDEIRPKYSRQRAWHEPEWMTRKVVEDARASWWEKRRLLSPKQEFMEAKKEEAKRTGVAREKQVTGQTANIIFQELNAAKLSSSRSATADTL